MVDVAIPLLSALPAEEYRALLAKAQRRTYRADEVIFREGDPPAFIFHVISGEINVTLSSEERRISVGRVGAGRLVGVLSLFDDGPHYLAAAAVSPTVVLAIPRDDLAAALRRHPEVMYRLAELVAQQVRGAAFLIAEMQFLDLPVRLAKRLLDLMDSKDALAPGPVDVKITQRELSELAGATRGGVNRVLKRMEELGIIGTGRGRLRILAPDRLRQLAHREEALPTLLGLTGSRSTG